MATLLRVQDLEVHYRTPEGPLAAVNGVSFTLERGEALGIVGESGCGKTTLARALLRILPPAAAIAGGRIELEGDDLLGLSESAMRRVRWQRIAMVPQSSMHALNPVHRIGDQIVEAIRAHEPATAAEARRRAAALLHTVGIEERRFSSYPHQLSGGQRQRVVIAMAMALNPQILIADEPTTALDVITQHSIVRELIRLRAELGIAILYISHDISLIAQTCARVAVMYAGRFAEVGPTADVLQRPVHPYTMGLRNAFPDLRQAGRLVSIPGAPPALTHLPAGCPFHPRCPFSIEVCRTATPPLAPVGMSHLAACHRSSEAAALREAAQDESTWERSGSPLRREGRPIMTPEPLVEVCDLRRTFTLRTGVFESAAIERTRVTALDGISFSIRPGRIVGLAGESGSGKSTLAELLAGLQIPTAGEIRFEGASVSDLLRRDPRRFRRRVQMIFQNPYESLNPRFTVEMAVEEPLIIHGIGTRTDRRERVLAVLDDCRLRPAASFLARYPHELSGGQRQRVAIARAIVVKPHFLVADEPVSMLDVSVRSGILNLIADLRARRGLTILFISHDLATVRYLCDETIILYRGRIMEQGPTARLIERPLHPYTAALVAAAPVADPTRPPGDVPVRGDEIGNQPGRSTGCVFAPRCPYAIERCRQEVPLLREIIPGVSAACHLATPDGVVAEAS